VALELAETLLPITCNAVCPGWVLTDLVQKQIDAIALERAISNEAATRELLSAKEPTQRFTTAQDIGEMVAFLCSTAGDNITGSEFALDGGWTAR
jgi:3-hydroxybutyrate dehydrogenase